MEELHFRKWNKTNDNFRFFKCYDVAYPKEDDKRYSEPLLIGMPVIPVNLYALKL